jgi:hypothetical protein
MLKRLATFASAVLVFSAMQLSASLPARAQTCFEVTLYSADAQLMVTAELNGTFSGQLRARTKSNAIGEWEKFTKCWLTNNVFTLKAHANGKYVSTRENYEGRYEYMLQAYADTVGSWELFVQYDYPDVVAFTGSPSYYVSCEEDYPEPDKNLLRARAKSLGPWEYWVFQRIF